MADGENTELLDNIEFLYGYESSGEQLCKHLTNDEFFSIMWLMLPNSYSFTTILKLLYPVWIEPIKKCWFRSEDWSHYSKVNKKQAHRLSYEIFIGSLIQGLEICHNCDRKGCINPWHLFQGTHGDNMKDMRNKGNGFFSHRDLIKFYSKGVYHANRFSNSNS